MSEANAMRVPYRLLAAGLALLAAGCRQDMYNQPKLEPQESSVFFADGKADRPLLPGVVPRLDTRNEPRDEQYDRFVVGVVDGKEVDEIPFPVDRAVLNRGRERYQIYCSPCHGSTGDGRGMIVQRGFSPPPPFYGPRPKTNGGSPAVTIYEDLRDAPVGHFYEVITHGHGAMYSYASRVAPRDRWAIAAYIRALQLSQHASVAELDERDRDQLPRNRP